MPSIDSRWTSEGNTEGNNSPNLPFRNISWRCHVPATKKPRSSQLCFDMHLRQLSPQFKRFGCRGVHWILAVWGFWCLFRLAWEWTMEKNCLSVTKPSNQDSKRTRKRFLGWVYVLKLVSFLWYSFYPEYHLITFVGGSNIKRSVKKSCEKSSCPINSVARRRRKNPWTLQTQPISQFSYTRPFSHPYCFTRHPHPHPRPHQLLSSQRMWAQQLVHRPCSSWHRRFLGLALSCWVRLLRCFLSRRLWYC